MSTGHSLGESGPARDGGRKIATLASQAPTAVGHRKYSARPILCESGPARDDGRKIATLASQAPTAVGHRKYSARLPPE